MDNSDYLNLDIDFDKINSHADYKGVWKRFHPVEVQMIEKNEECLHNLSDAFIYNNHYDKPAGICSALHHVLQFYLWRASIGFPSWEQDRSVYRVHCPDKKGIGDEQYNYVHLLHPVFGDCHKFEKSAVTSKEGRSAWQECFEHLSTWNQSPVVHRRPGLSP